jgi:hypothetical protein
LTYIIVNQDVRDYPYFFVSPNGIDQRKQNTEKAMWKQRMRSRIEQGNNPP